MTQQTNTTTTPPVEGSAEEQVTAINKELLKKAKPFFDKHKVDVLYFTSDETAFFSPYAANTHGQTLKDKTVTEIRKTDISNE
jgi:hypothetical protein